VPGKILLDTTAIIALFNQDQAIIASLSEVEETFAPSIAVGELFYGSGSLRLPLSTIWTWRRATPTSERSKA
jgi:tRNA(fMet)-specific endonuclease VapC